MKIPSKIKFILIITFIITCTAQTSASANTFADRKKGDWVEFEEWWENPTWDYSILMRFEIESITDDSVTIRLDTESFSGKKETFSKIRELTDEYWWFGYGPDHKLGDKINYGNASLTINEEVIKTYAGVTRTVLIAEGTGEEFDGKTEQTYMEEKKMYIDKETGILLEYWSPNDGYVLARAIGVVLLLVSIIISRTQKQ